MTTHPTIVPLPNREPTGHGSTELVLVLGVAAFVLGVGMVSQGVVLAQPPAHLLPTTHAALGGVEPLVPAGDDRPVAVTPLGRSGPTHARDVSCQPRRDPAGRCLPPPSRPGVRPASGAHGAGAAAARPLSGATCRTIRAGCAEEILCVASYRGISSPLPRHRHPPLHNRKILAVERRGAVPRKPPHLVGRPHPVPVSPLPGIDRRELPSDDGRASSYCSSDSVLGIVWLDVVSGRPCQHLILSMPRDRQPTSNPPSVAPSGPSHG